MDDDGMCELAEVGGGILISIFMSSDDAQKCQNLQERFEGCKLTINDLIKEGMDLVDDKGKRNLSMARRRAREEGINLDTKLSPNWRKCIRK